MHLLSLAGDRLWWGQDKFTNGLLRPWLQVGTRGRGLLRTTGRQKETNTQKLPYILGIQFFAAYILHMHIPAYLVKANFLWTE